MKGVVYDLLQRAVIVEHGEDAWDELLAAAGVSGAYTTLGSYPDAELAALVNAASARYGMAPDDVVRWFARRSFPTLADRHPDLFARHRSARTFLLELNEVIHPEVRKIYPGALAPDFHYALHGEEVHLEYSSPRKLCAFAEGLVHGLAAHYHERVVVTQPRCTKRGDPACHLVCDFGAHTGG